jgi:hypothetical protein
LHGITSAKIAKLDFLRQLGKDTFFGIGQRKLSWRR